MAQKWKQGCIIIVANQRFSQHQSDLIRVIGWYNERTCLLQQYQMYSYYVDVQLMYLQNSIFHLHYLHY